MVDMRDDIEKVLADQTAIAEMVEKIGKQITKDYEGKKLLLVGVLKGCVVFMADLMRAINIPAEIDFFTVSSYGNGVKSSGEVKIVKDLQVDVTQYHVLLVEDILDSGRTLNFLKNLLAQRGAKSIRICTFLDKPDRREADIHPDYVGFTVPDEFVVGYGLDYAEKYRNLPYVGILKTKIYYYEQNQ